MHLYEIVSAYKEDAAAVVSQEYIERFETAIYRDLNMPEALAVMWAVLRSDLTEATKLATVIRMDKVFGLDLEEHLTLDIPSEVMDLARTRMLYRKSGIWDKADLVRRQISELGYLVEDLANGNYKVKKRF
jgi:cysteinyl-tRNA synthetase